MNEQIKALAQQAGESIPEFHFGDWNIPNEFIQKFAQLIVQECATAITNDNFAKDCSTFFFMDSYAKGMRYSAHLIKEHFGVE
jgi:hypothetical protein